MKVRDYQGKRVNPHKGITCITKVVPLKLILDMVPSSSEDVTHKIRRQPKRLSRDYGRRNGEKCVERSFYVFCFSKDVS